MDQLRPGESIVIRLRGRRAFLCQEESESLATATLAVRTQFRIPQDATIVFLIKHSYIEPGSKVGLVELTQGSWKYLALATGRPVLEVQVIPPPPPAAVDADVIADDDERYRIVVRNVQGPRTARIPNFDDHRFKVRRAAIANRLYMVVAEKAHVDVHRLRLTLNGRRLLKHNSFEECGLRGGDVIEASLVD